MVEPVFWKQSIGKVGFILAFIWLLTAFFVTGAAAEEIWHTKTGFAVGLSAGVHPFISGTAGTGPGAPDYNDLFGTGRSLFLEAERPVNKRISLLVSAGYEKYPGKAFQGMAFDDLEIVPLYAGCKFHLTTRASLSASLRARIGIAYLSSVDDAWGSYRGTYWYSSRVPTGDIGLVLGRRMDNWDISAGLSLRYTGAPDNSFPSAAADDLWTLPVQFSIRYSF